MAGSSIGTIFRITTFGESHGKGIGVIIDGCPAGLRLSEELVQPYLDRRAPGQSKFSTPRKEADQVQILSGTFEGKTTGTPITMLVLNQNQQSKDYSEIASYYRPGHADFGFDEKYGFRDYRGGGRSSGRETIGRVAAGAVADLLLKEMGINIKAYAKAIGPYRCESFDLAEIDQNPLRMPDHEAFEKAEEFLVDCMQKGDSAGGIIECIIEGVPAGIGDPVFEKLDANLAKAIFSIGAVKGFEIGDGFAAAAALGTENNDAFTMEGDRVTKKTNHAGGILGGISDGTPIVFRAAIKPTPSVSATQETVNKDGQDISINIKGRHDPIIVPRAVPVVEAMAAITVLDAMLVNQSAKLNTVVKNYSRN